MEELKTLTLTEAAELVKARWGGEVVGRGDEVHEKRGYPGWLGDL